MFELEKTKVIEGTVKEFQWTNPHSWIMLAVDDAPGRAEQWAIEMGAPGRLTRQGWVRTTLVAGMSTKAVIHPLRDGNDGGQFMAATLPNGTPAGQSGCPAKRQSQRCKSVSGRGNRFGIENRYSARRPRTPMLERCYCHPLEVGRSAFGGCRTKKLIGLLGLRWLCLPRVQGRHAGPAPAHGSHKLEVTLCAA